MELATFAISLLIFIGLLWLHRRQLKRAYAAGWAAALTDRDRIERHGLAELPTTDH